GDDMPCATDWAQEERGGDLACSLARPLLREILAQRRARRTHTAGWAQHVQAKVTVHEVLYATQGQGKESKKEDGLGNTGCWHVRGTREERRQQPHAAVVHGWNRVDVATTRWPSRHTARPEVRETADMDRT